MHKYSISYITFYLRRFQRMNIICVFFLFFIRFSRPLYSYIETTMDHCHADQIKRSLLWSSLFAGIEIVIMGCYVFIHHLSVRLLVATACWFFYQHPTACLFRIEWDFIFHPFCSNDTIFYIGKIVSRICNVLCDQFLVHISISFIKCTLRIGTCV